MEKGGISEEQKRLQKLQEQQARTSEREQIQDRLGGLNDEMIRLFGSRLARGGGSARAPMR